MINPRLRPLALALLLAVAPALHAQSVPAPMDTAYTPGPITVQVDATNLAQRIVRVRQQVPVAPGPLTLLYPEWLPGNHAPRGPIDKVAGPVGEALIMTGVGLAVAIPAVMGYNWLTRTNRVLTARMDAFAHELFTFLSMGQLLGGKTGNAPVREIKPQSAAR